jgi:hypothetical protein
MYISYTLGLYVTIPSSYEFGTSKFPTSVNNNGEHKLQLLCRLHVYTCQSPLANWQRHARTQPMRVSLVLRGVSRMFSSGEGRDVLRKKSVFLCFKVIRKH